MIPQQLIGGFASLPELLRVECRKRGMVREERESIVAMLPPTLEQATCFLDRLTTAWRYDFGSPFTNVPGVGTVFGTMMWHPVESLLDSLIFFRDRLPIDRREAFLARLDVADKHEETLLECAPILRLEHDVTVNHEVSGWGEGNSTIDWIVGPPQTPELLLEVKVRRRDIMEHLTLINPGVNSPADIVPPPIHEVELLFRSVEKKFKRSDNAIQAVWINTNLKQEQSELRSAFDALDPKRVHCALLGDWEDDVTILARSEDIKNRVIQLLHLHPSDRFTFRRGVEG